MRVLVTGAHGQLGHDVMLELTGRGHCAIGYRSAELDITDRLMCFCRFRESRPDAVIHCAAWTAVDAAEDANNFAKVHAINAEGTRNIAEACKAFDCKLLYISTDYVFNGKGELPWSADNEQCDPINMYGRTKLEGEKLAQEILEKVFVVRTAWLYGAHGGNFISAIVNYGRNHDSIRVVEDQIGTPTYTVDLARLLVDMIESEKYGVYHAVNEGGFVSRYDLARTVFHHMSIMTKVIPIKTAEYGGNNAARPLNSRMNTDALAEGGFMRLPDWHNALARYLDGIP